MNKELDALLCLLDGKITAYRMDNKDVPIDPLMKLIQIQLDIQTLWQENKDSD